MEEVVRTTTARCLVITGADPAFCSGDDVKQVMAGAGERVSSGLRAEPALTPLADALLHTDVPVVAAVNGAAVGWGMELAIMADIRVASERAKLGELFVMRGLCCDAPGLGRLNQLVGREVAAELLFTGRIVGAAEAKELKLVSRVVPHEELLTVALELARRIAANPPLAVQRIKRGLREALDPDWREPGGGVRLCVWTQEWAWWRRWPGGECWCRAPVPPRSCGRWRGSSPDGSLPSRLSRCRGSSGGCAKRSIATCASSAGGCRQASASSSPPKTTRRASAPSARSATRSSRADDRTPRSRGRGTTPDVARRPRGRPPRRRPRRRGGDRKSTRLNSSH